LKKPYASNWVALPFSATNPRRKTMDGKSDMKWWHWVILLTIFGSVPFAESIADGILRLVGVK